MCKHVLLDSQRKLVMTTNFSGTFGFNLENFSIHFCKADVPSSCCGCSFSCCLLLGLGFDCPVFDELFNCVSIVAGGTLTAAELLNKQECNIAINWQGGWHHAQRYTYHRNIE